MSFFPLSECALPNFVSENICNSACPRLRCSILGFPAALGWCEVVLIFITAPPLLLVVVEVRIHLGRDRACAVMVSECMRD